ncbi:hypothetical protein HDV00_001298 [Rhizophlyctis rosea]|nr:hypothetical protein HDV00_001298 [Rhizophlyctis rosea]
MRSSLWLGAAVAFCVLGTGQTQADFVTGQNSSTAKLERTKRAPLVLSDDPFSYASLTDIAALNQSDAITLPLSGPVPVLGYHVFTRHLDAHSPGAEPLGLIRYEPDVEHKGLKKRAASGGMMDCFKARGGQSIAEYASDTFGFEDADGQDLIENKKGTTCGRFPLMPNKTYSVAAWEVDDLAEVLRIGGCVNPFWNLMGSVMDVFDTVAQKGYLNFAGPLQLICVLRNDRDEFLGLAFTPSFFPGADKLLQFLPPPWTITPTLRGFAGDASGSLAYGHVQNITVWNGQFAVLFQPETNFWVGIDIDFAASLGSKIPKSTKKLEIGVSVSADLFGGWTSSTNTVFLNIASIDLTVFGFIPLLKIGTGYAGWIFNDRTAQGEADEICHPSGIFTSIDLGARSPFELDGIAAKFFEFGPGRRADVAILFRDKVFNGFAFRVVIDTKFLGIQLSKIQVELQWINNVELQRRKLFLNQTSGCCTSYDKKGLCLDYGVPTGVESTAPSGLRPVDMWLYAQPPGGYMIIYVGARKTLGFGIAVQLTDLIIIAAFQTEGTNAPDGDNPFFVYVEAEIRALMIVGVNTTVILTDRSGFFEVSLSILGIMNTVTGKSGTPAGLGDGSDVTNTDFDLSWHSDFSNLGEVISKAVTAALKAVAEFAKKVWDEVSAQINKIGNAIKAAFAPGGALEALGNLLGDSFGTVFNNVVSGVIGAVGAVIGHFADTFNSLVDAASKFLKGDIWGGLDLSCTTERGAYEVDKECVQKVAAEALRVKEAAMQQERKAAILAASQANNQGLLFILNGGFVPADALHFGGADYRYGSTLVQKPAGLQRRNQGSANIDVPVQMPELDTTSQGFKAAPISKTYSASFNDINDPDQFYLDSQSTIDSFITRAAKDIQGANGLGPEILAERESRTPPVLTAPTPKTFKCSVNIYERTDLLGKPTVRLLLSHVTVDPYCQPATTQFGVSLAQDVAGNPKCGGLLVRATWTFRDTCGQEATPVVQNIMIDPEPPKWIPYQQGAVAPVADVKVSCESDVSPLVTGMAAARSGCVGAGGGILVTYTDAAPVLISCGLWEIKRTWKAAAVGCPNDPDQTITYVQTITVEDKVAPYWDSAFPADATVDFLSPYGTGTLGYPKAFDSCGQVPVVITYEDMVTSNNVQCAAEKVMKRTWTAKDSCGNAAVRNQIIAFTNTKRYFGDATLMQVYGGTSSQISSCKIGGQVAGASTLVASSNTIGYGTCAYTANALVIEAAGVVSSNKLYNGKQVTNANTWGFAAAKTAMIQFSKSLTQQNTPQITGLHVGASVISCPLGTVATRANAPQLFTTQAFLFGVPNYINHGTCAVTTTKTATQIAATTTTTSYVLTGSDLVYNIFTLPQAVLAKAVTIQITVPATSISFINVVGAAATTISLNAITLTGADPRTVLWNFPDTTYIANSKASLIWSGSILAPNAYFVSNVLNVKGQLLAGGGVSVSSMTFDCAHFAAFRFCKDVDSVMVKI